MAVAAVQEVGQALNCVRNMLLVRNCFERLLRVSHRVGRYFDFIRRQTLPQIWICENCESILAACTYAGIEKILAQYVTLKEQLVLQVTRKLHLVPYAGRMF